MQAHTPNEERPVNTQINTQTRRQRTTPGLVRRMLLAAAAGFVITAAAFASVAVLVDQFQLEMTYGEAFDTSTSTSAVGH
jgi:hypothetical protein